MAVVTIRPLHLGSITRQTMVFAYWLRPGVIIDAPIIAWYIEGPHKKILVDSGGGDPDSSTVQRFKPYKREKHQAVENALENIGVKCDDIDIVVATHLHWDHCGGNALFPNAKIIVREEELKAALSPFPVQHGYERSLIESIDYKVVTEDLELDEGVRTVFTPGHTYGLQGVLVEAPSTRYFIAGDTIGLFENLGSNPFLISGIYVDMKLYYETMKKIVGLSAFVLPGHDMKVFEKEIYA